MAGYLSGARRREGKRAGGGHVGLAGSEQYGRRSSVYFGINMEKARTDGKKPLLLLLLGIDIDYKFRIGW